jgi:hypothetical protein
MGDFDTFTRLVLVAFVAGTTSVIVIIALANAASHS